MQKWLLLLSFSDQNCMITMRHTGQAGPARSHFREGQQLTRIGGTMAQPWAG
jgi:hypothetical protein